MRKLVIVGALLLLTGTTTLASEDVLESTWDGESPVDFPEMRIGDSWTYSGYSSNYGSDLITEEVVGVGEDHFVLLRGEEKSHNEYHKMIQRFDHYPYLPTIEGLDFPLEVGKKWRLQYEGNSIDGETLLYTNNYKVLKVESISVKAGKFKTFKIRLRLNSQGVRPATKYIWYSPDVKRIIRTKPNWRKGEELISYELISPE